MPFAIYEDDITPPGTTVTLYDDNVIVPGVFGLLDFDGGENSTDDLVDWIDNGYGGELWIDPAVGYLLVEGNPGFVDALGKPVGDHVSVGDVVVACVYSEVWSGGANTTFKVIGFVPLVITEQGKEKVDGVMTKYIRATILGAYFVGSGNTAGSMQCFLEPRLVQ
jgi:hypothetical protein